MSWIYKTLIEAADKAEYIEDYKTAIQKLQQALDNSVKQGGRITKKMLRERIIELKTKINEL